MGASGRMMELSVMMVLLLLSVFPFYNSKWEVGVNNHVGCKYGGGGWDRKIGNGIGLMCHGGWRCQRRLL